MMKPNPRVIRFDPMIEDAIRNDRCYMGGEKVFQARVRVGHRATPGQIYSEAGLREYKQSGACEFHFDQAFAEPDEEHLSEEEEPLSPEEEEMAPQDEKIL
jgi:hypothetical protein